MADWKLLDREQRGMLLAAMVKIVQRGKEWVVPSQTGNGTKYTVNPDEQTPCCTCPDFETFGCTCKHILAVRIVRQRELFDDGAEVVTESVSLAQTVQPKTANFHAIAKHGATGFIPFRNWTTGAVGGLFAKAFHYFSLHREEFLRHYHKRSNVETAVMMIKSKFGDAVRSKTETAMRNEVLCKVLSHNICCLIQAMHELGIRADFVAAPECA